MQALVKTPLIEITAKGEIPKKVLAVLKKEFGNDLEINDDDELIDAFESEWYKNIKKDWHPGKSVRVYRDNAGLSQAALAEKLGVIPSNISEIERGKRGVGKEMAKKLSKVLKAPIERFL
jgi:DNA-binding XRE family transcriptional regulator